MNGIATYFMSDFESSAFVGKNRQPQTGMFHFVCVTTTCSLDITSNNCNCWSQSISEDPAITDHQYAMLLCCIINFPRRWQVTWTKNGNWSALTVTWSVKNFRETQIRRRSSYICESTWRQLLQATKSWFSTNPILILYSYQKSGMMKTS